MKCKFKQLNDALDYFRYNVPSKYDAEVEIFTREENFEDSKLLSCLTMVITYEKDAEQYDRYQGKKSIKHTLEVYPESENRVSRLTTEESQELIPKRS